MYKLATSDFKTNALSDLSLLQDVVRFKSRFYRCSWAHFEEARPGTFKLAPKDEHLAALLADYRQMVEMIFGEIPDFEQILDTLRQLENEINQLFPESPQEEE